jgi:hypothetical protein
LGVYEWMLAYRDKKVVIVFVRFFVRHTSYRALDPSGKVLGQLAESVIQLFALLAH